MDSHDVSKMYQNAFSEYVFKKYGEDEPLFIPKIFCRGPIVEDDISVYEECLKIGKPWQEIPSVARKVKRALKKYEKDCEDGGVV